MTSALQERLDTIRAELASAAHGDTPTLVAVSKTVDSRTIRDAYEAGQRDFGENRVQDLLAKMNQLADLPDIRWHFIGRLQRNKVRKIIGRVHAIHSVDSLRLAQAIARIAEEENCGPQSVFLEVNTSMEESKAGFSPSALRSELLSELLSLPRLDVCGLMTMAPFVDDEDTLTTCFETLRDLSLDCQRNERFGSGLSMGMSNDFLLATRAGATHVRIGSRIFHGR